MTQPADRDYWLRRDAWPLYLFCGVCFIIGAAGVVESVARDNAFFMILGLVLVGGDGWILYRLTTRLGAPPDHGHLTKTGAISRLSWRRVRSAVRRDADVIDDDIGVARKYVDRATAPRKLVAPAVAILAGLALTALELGRPHPSDREVILGVAFVAFGTWDIWWRLSVARWANRHGLTRN